MLTPCVKCYRVRIGIATINFRQILPTSEIIMDITKFKGLLDEQNTWPNNYTFKFVTKTEVKTQLTTLLSDHQITEKLSRNGKYTSVTSRKIFNSADEVIEVYNRISEVEGVIPL